MEDTQDLPNTNPEDLLTDEFEGEVFVGSGLFGVFVEEHDGAPDAAVLQSLLAHTGQLQTHRTHLVREEHSAGAS